MTIFFSSAMERVLMGQTVPKVIGAESEPEPEPEHPSPPADAPPPPLAIHTRYKMAVAAAASSCVSENLMSINPVRAEPSSTTIQCWRLALAVAVRRSPERDRATAVSVSRPRINNPSGSRKTPHPSPTHRFSPPGGGKTTRSHAGHHLPPPPPP